MRSVPIKGVLFDQDGLLFDTEVVFRRAWNTAGIEMGLNVPNELLSQCCGCGTDILPKVIGKFLPQELVQEFIQRAFKAVIADQLANTPILKPGVRQILERCRQLGLLTALATSSIRSLVDHNLEKTGLTKFFDAIVVGGEVKCGKPAPDIFLLAASKLGLVATECLVFEDAPVGILAACAAGCRAVMIPDCIQPTPEIMQLCQVRSSLCEALDFLQV